MVFMWVVMEEQPQVPSQGDVLLPQTRSAHEVLEPFGYSRW